MPIYEYACEECGHRFERLQRISDDPVSDCPECEAEGAIKKLVSQSSFVLKGGGWYSDHYGLKSGSGGGSKPSSEGSSSSESSSAGSSSEGSSSAGSSSEGSSSSGGSSSSSSSDSSSSGSDD